MSFLGGSSALLDRAPLDTLLIALALDDALDEDPGGMNRVRIELADIDELFHLRDRHLARSGHHRVEVHRRVSIDQVAEAIAPPRLDDRKVSGDGRLEDIGLAIEFAELLLGRALRDGAVLRVPQR